MLREIAPTVIFDDVGRLLLQQRDDIPGILYPGAIGLFGGHRAKSLFWLARCEKFTRSLAFMCPRNGSIFYTRFEGADPENPEGTVRAECFIVRGLRVSDLTITEGQLLVVEASELNAIRQ